MVEISNIDAIVELILREARARKGFELQTRISMVQREVIVKLGEIMDNLEQEERRKKDD